MSAHKSFTHSQALYPSLLPLQVKLWNDISYTPWTDTGTHHASSAPAASPYWPILERVVSRETEWFYARLITLGEFRFVILSTPIHLFFCFHQKRLKSRNRAESIKFQLNDVEFLFLHNIFKASQVISIFLLSFLDFGDHANRTLRAATEEKNDERMRSISGCRRFKLLSRTTTKNVSRGVIICRHKYQLQSSLTWKANTFVCGKMLMNYFVATK